MMQGSEIQSGRSGQSGQVKVDGGFIDPTIEKLKSGRSGQVGSGQVILPKGYGLNAEGIYFIENPDKPDEKIWLGAPIYFQAMTRNGDSEAWGLLIGWKDPDGILHWWAMPYSVLTDARQSWRAELASGGWRGATSQKAKALLGQLLASVVVQDRARCVDRGGWHGNAYVRPGAVFGQGEERLVLQVTTGANPFTQAGTLEAWNATIGTWAKGNRLLMFGISAALSGFLLDLAGLDSGGFHFWGHSSTGKTTIMRAARSVDGGPAGVRTWRSTSNGLEGVSALYNDACLCLDELGQAPARTIGEFIYMVCNGQSKNRMNGDGSARAPKTWRLLLLSNGEMTIADKVREDGQQVRAGQEVRIVDLSADAGAGMGAWQDLHRHETPGQFSDAIKAACAASYGTLGRAYIEALTRSREELNLAQDLAAVVSAWTPAGSSGQVRRVIDRFALAGVAGELAVGFGLVPWAEGEPMAAARQCLDSWLEGRGSTGDQEDRRAVDTVRAFIARYGSSRFHNIDLGAPERILDRAGFRRTLNGQEQFLFTGDQFKAVLGGLNQATAAKALDRAGLLHRNDGKNLTVRVPLPDLGKVRVYAVTMPDDEGGQPC